MPMSCYSTRALVLRRVAYGEADWIITLFSPEKGKITVFAKGARKSRKRFSGVLELFSIVSVVVVEGKGLPLLQEASLLHPFAGIRSDIEKTAFASYWMEILLLWTENEQQQLELYHLAEFSLAALDQGDFSPVLASICFQIRFMKYSGMGPSLFHCCRCCRELARTGHARMEMDIIRGGAVCPECRKDMISETSLSRGTLNLLEWMEKTDFDCVFRVRADSFSIQEGNQFLESFVPYHLGKTPRSLSFLRELRADGIRRKRDGKSRQSETGE